ncbi:MAG: BON domain-containing protein [Acidimicrobiales bacterium]
MSSSDEKVRQAVKEALARDPLLVDLPFDASVEDGTVTLEGAVSTLAHKLAAQGATLAVPGVHNVIDRVEVDASRSGPIADAALISILAQVLAWDALVAEDHVQISVSAGWVHLDGEVPTVQQRREAERAVSQIVGVRGVTNRLTIHSSGITPEEVHLCIEQALVRRARHWTRRIDVLVDGDRVTLTGEVESDGERVAALGAAGHAVGVGRVCDELRVRRSAGT